MRITVYYYPVTYKKCRYHVFLFNGKLQAVKLPGDHLDVTDRFTEHEISVLERKAVKMKRVRDKEPQA